MILRSPARFVALALAIAAAAVGASAQAHPAVRPIAAAAFHPTPDGTPNPFPYYAVLPSQIRFKPIPPPCYECPPFQIDLTTYQQLVQRLGNPTQVSGNVASWTRSAQGVAGGTVVNTVQTFSAILNSAGQATQFNVSVTQSQG